MTILRELITPLIESGKSDSHEEEKIAQMDPQKLERKGLGPPYV